MAQEARTVEIRAMLNDPTNAGVEFQVQTASKVFNKLPMVAEGFASSIKVEAPQDTINLYGPQPSDPKALPQVMASGKIPSSTQRCMLIIVPQLPDPKADTPAAKQPYRLVAIDDSPQAFPFGESRIVNLTKVGVGMQAGGTKLAIPGEKVVTLPPVKELNDFNVAQTNFYALSGNGDWVPFTERQIQYVNSLRRVFVVYVSPGSVAPTVRTVSDHEPAPVPKS